MSETIEVTGSAPSTEVEPVEKPKLEAATLCTICSKNLKHGDVVMLGRDKDGYGITVHPRCVQRHSNVKTLEQMHIHLDPKRPVSNAMRRIIQSRVKVLY